MFYLALEILLPESLLTTYYILKNGICLESVTSKQNALFSKKCAPKCAPTSSLSRIGPVYRLCGKYS